MYCIKPNEYEAEILSGIKVSNEQSALNACKKITERNIKTVFISCGEAGSYCYQNGVFNRVPFFKTDVVNTTGAGDSFMAGVVYGYIKGMGIKKSAQFAAACSSITVASMDTVCKDLTVQKAVDIVNKNA